MSNKGKFSKKNGKGKNFRKDYKKSDSLGRDGDKPTADKGAADWNNYHSNDPAYWNQVGSVMDAAARIPFNRLAGYNYDISTGMYNDLHDEDRVVSMGLPTMMTIDYVPGIGVSREYNDAPNRAFQAIYSYIYSKTTGAIQFPQYAVALTQIATSSIAQNIAVCKRALGVACMYSAANKSYPREVLRALGFEPDSVINNLAVLRSRLNNVILDFNTLPLISSNLVFKRQFGLCNSIYLDNANIGAQMYIFRPQIAYIYSDLGRYVDGEYDGKACCVPVFMPYYDNDGTFVNPTLTTLDKIMDLIDTQIQAIRNSADFALISGSIMRAYEGSSFVRIDPVPDGYQQVITADDPYISYQIHNMNIPGRMSVSTRIQPNVPSGYLFYGAGGCDITGDPVTNQLQYLPKLRTDVRYGGRDDDTITNASGVGKCDFILNTFENAVDTNWILESTRLMSAWEVESDNVIKAATLSTEFVGSARIWAPNADQTQVYSVELFPNLITVSSAEHGSNSVLINQIRNCLEKFHKAPRFWCAVESKSEGEIPIVGISTTANDLTGDLNYWSVITNEQLKLLNVPALLSIFGLKG